MARFAAAVNALQVAALEVVGERPAMDLEPLQHVLVADDVREVLVPSVLPSPAEPFGRYTKTRHLAESRGLLRPLRGSASPRATRRLRRGRITRLKRRAATLA